MEKVFEKKSNIGKKVNDIVGDDPMLKAGYEDLETSKTTKTAVRRIVDPDQKPQKRKEIKKNRYDLENLMNYIEETLYELNGVVNDDEDIFEESKLYLDDNSLYFNIHSELFKKRFLTFYLISLYDGVEDIVDTYYYLKQGEKPLTPKSKSSTTYKNIEKTVCEEVQKNIEKMIKSIFGRNKDTYKYLINLTVLQLCYPLKREKKTFEKEYIDTLEKCIVQMREICKTDIFNKRSKYDDYIVLHLFRTGFCFAIESMKCDSVIRFDNLKNCKLNCNFDKACIMLGHGIFREKQRNKDTKVLPLFNAFADAHPLIATNIPSCNTLKETNVAINAIYLIKFLCNDRNVDKVIDEILR